MNKTEQGLNREGESIMNKPIIHVDMSGENTKSITITTQTTIHNCGECPMMNKENSLGEFTCMYDNHIVGHSTRNPNDRIDPNCPKLPKIRGEK